MSFLTEILNTAEQTDREFCKKHLPMIIEKIEHCKGDLNGYIQGAYSKYKEWPNKTQRYIEAATLLSNDIQELQVRVERIVTKDVTGTIKELDHLSTELQCSNAALDVVLRLVKINELISNVKEFEKKKLYTKAAKELLQVEEHVKTIPDADLTEAVSTLKHHVFIARASLTKKLSGLFEDYVAVSETTSGKSSAPLISYQVKIKHKNEEMMELLSVLDSFDMLDYTLGPLANFLCQNLCKATVFNITSIKVEAQSGIYVLNVAVKKSNTKIPYKEVFSKIIELFTFFHKNFNFKIAESNTISYLGNRLVHNLSEMILNSCVSDSLPLTKYDCTRYQDTIKDLRAFQNNLVALEFIPEDNNPFLDYAGNMDLMYINKKCHEYLSQAIGFMKKDLHDLVDVGITQDGGNPLTSDEFPESSVSRSTIEILELVQTILQEALTKSDVCAARIICTAQSIMYQYGNIVYGHHERLLLTIPQQVALFRNNCMYVAHQLSQLNQAYTSKFPISALPTPQLFTDQMHQLQTIGGEIFLTYVEEQIQLMEGTLIEYQFQSSRLANEQLHFDTDKCLRQCVRQHELLKTVWFNVLPHSVYNKTVGYLFNHFCKLLIEVVTGAEDISSKIAAQLVELYKVVQARGPKLFVEPSEICVHVQNWQKLNDLVFVLGASLAEIHDRWADGKGTLTLFFKAEELKGLIKALFQNTDRRAAVLSRIHN